MIVDLNENQITKVHTFVQELLRKLNIQDKDIYSVTLKVQADELPIVTISRYVQVNENYEVNTEEFNLVPR